MLFKYCLKSIKIIHDLATVPNFNFQTNKPQNGFNIIHCHRNYIRGGGVAILYKTALYVKEGSVECQKHFAYVTLVLYDKTKILLICIYIYISRKQEVPCSV